MVRLNSPRDLRWHADPLDNVTEYCGAGNRLNVYGKNGTFTPATTLSNSIATETGPVAAPTATATSGPQIKQAIGSWSFEGCWTEATNGRALGSKTYAAESMTLESCASFCSGFSMFGVEYGRECYCGNTLRTGSVKATDQAGCSFTCPGDGTEFCGAGNRLQLYAYNSNSESSSSSSISTSLSGSETAAIATSVTASSSSTFPTPTGPTIVPSVGLYDYIGCFTEAINARALGAALHASDENTIAACAAACSAYQYFGAEYGRECWCGNSFAAGSVLTSDSDCLMTCAGDDTSYCGAGNRLSVYVKNGTSGGSDSSSSSASISSSSVAPSQIPSVDSPSSPTSIAQSSVLTSSSSSVEPTSSTSDTTSNPTPTQTLAIKETVGSYTYQGCYTEATKARALTGASFYNYTAMTLEMCASSCSAFTYWGVEYGGECYCGNTLNPTSVLAAKQKDCSFTCPGDQYEYCGAGNRLDMYKLTSVPSSIDNSDSTPVLDNNAVVSTNTISSSSTPALPTTSPSSQSSPTSPQAASYTGPPVPSTGNANFTYYSCISEPSSSRLLPFQISNNGTHMTIEKCLSDCWMYQYAGVEYGRECWCGDELNLGAGAMNVSDEKCGFTCPGNGSEYCGSGGHLSLFWFDVEKAVGEL